MLRTSGSCVNPHPLWDSTFHPWLEAGVPPQSDDPPATTELSATMVEPAANRPPSL